MVKNTVLLATACVTFLAIFYWISPSKSEVKLKEKTEVVDQNFNINLDFGHVHVTKQVRKWKPKHFKKIEVHGDKKIVFSWKCSNFTRTSKISRKDTGLQYFPHSDVFVYSAYLDLRHHMARSIKIMGLSAQRQMLNLYIQMQYEDGVVYSGTSLTEDLQSNYPHPHRPKHQRNSDYSSKMFTCDERRNMTPVSVTLTNRTCLKNVPKYIKVQEINPKNDQDVLKYILVCVKRNSFQSKYRLIEFLEYQKIMGADHVVIYDDGNANDDVSAVIYKYRKDGYLTVQKWSDFEGKSRHGLIAQINDCLYRYMNLYKYILYMDPDEFIVPSNPSIKSYKDIIETLNSNKTHFLHRASHFSFVTTQYCLSSSETNSRKPELLLLAKFKKESPKKHGDRSKCLINPRRVDQMGVNKVKQRHGFWKGIKVPPEVAMLHRYRNQKHHHHHHHTGCNNTDTVSPGFGKVLIKQVNQVCKELGVKLLPYN